VTRSEAIDVNDRTATELHLVFTTTWTERMPVEISQTIPPPRKSLALTRRYPQVVFPVP
jgi:hypothetical protein